MQYFAMKCFEMLHFVSFTPVHPGRLRLIFGPVVRAGKQPRCVLAVCLIADTKCGGAADQHLAAEMQLTSIGQADRIDPI
jgi:hypothetical protein